MRRLGMTFLLALAALVVFPAGGAGAATVDVSVRSNEFVPRVVTVNPGDTVRWILASGQHNVKSDEGSPETFASPDPLLLYSRVFSNPGIYRYYCSYHATKGLHDTDMKGAVVVLDPDARTFYFAEGTVRPGFTEFVTLQNPVTPTATAALIFQASDDSALSITVPSLAVSLPGSSRKTVNVNDYVASQGITVPINVSIQVVADGPIVAERPLYFNTGLAGGSDGGTDVIGATSIGSTYNFAEGTVRDGFTEFLTFQNPLSTTTTAAVTFQASNDAGDPVTISPLTVTIPAAGRVTRNVNEYLAGKGVALPVNLSTRVVADGGKGIVVERPLYFHTALAGGVDGGTTVIGAREPAKSFYFAEGTVREGFTEFVTLQNPLTSTATSVLAFQMSRDDGTAVAVAPLTVTLPASSRKTVNVNDYLAAQEISPPLNVSVQVSADKPVVAERPLYFNTGLAGGVDGGTDVIGATSLASTYNFAEGTVREGFTEFLTFQNPLTSTATAVVTFQASDDAGVTVTVSPLTVTIPASSRVTRNINDHLASRNVALPVNLSARVVTDGGRRIVVERPLYFRTSLAGGVDGGTTVVGFTQ